MSRTAGTSEPLSRAHTKRFNRIENHFNTESRFREKTRRMTLAAIAFKKPLFKKGKSMSLCLLLAIYSQFREEEDDEDDDDDNVGSLRSKASIQKRKKVRHFLSVRRWNFV